MAHKEQLMDETSVTRVPASPTRAIVADEAFCGQAAAVLLCVLLQPFRSSEPFGAT